jgi:hypothetical protein
MRIRAKTLAIILLWSGATAVAAPWITGVGRVPLSRFSQEQAKIEALKLARQNASESAGVEISGQTLHLTSEVSTRAEVFDSFVKLVRSQASGRIVNQKEPVFTFPSYPGPGGEPQIWCEANVQVEIMADTAAPDPLFQVELKTDRESYREGEDMKLRLTSTKTCWMTIFNLYGDNHAALIYPNKFWKGRSLVAGNQLVLPPSTAASLPVELEPGLADDAELILTVATLDSLPFPTPPPGDSLATYDEALRRINTWIMTIPRVRRTEASAVFRIYKN